MALREVRIYIETGDKDLDAEFSKDVYHPFNFYMDKLMRGRFKEYSGQEVKGVNLVNLMLYTQEFLKVAEERGFSEFNNHDEWIVALNTLQLESDIDLNELDGNRVERVSKAIDIFITHAGRSDLPQMKRLVKHLKESKGKQSIEDAIKKADEFLEKLHAKWSQQQI